ncbi:hypothetical protein, partial [Escherichia coli]|uniref:hypothetical protein n=1 Tax=Escherichia coli TaxID=562 RepID=UPI00200F24BE
SHPLRRNNAVAMGAMMYFIIFSQDIRRPPRLFKNEGIGWVLRHFRVSENDKKGTQMFLTVIVIGSPLKPTSSVFRR